MSIDKKFLIWDSFVLLVELVRKQSNVVFFVG